MSTDRKACFGVSDRDRRIRPVLPRARRAALAALLLWAAAGAAAAADLTFSAAWARATPPGAETAAAYLDIVNGGDAPDALVGAASDAARAVEIHATVERNGLLEMRKLDSLPLPAGELTRLEPGGMHVMFVGLVRPFVPGGFVKVTLMFEQAGPIEIEMPIRDARQPRP